MGDSRDGWGLDESWTSLRMDELLLGGCWSFTAHSARKVMPGRAFEMPSEVVRKVCRGGDGGPWCTDKQVHSR